MRVLAGLVNDGGDVDLVAADGLNDVAVHIGRGDNGDAAAGQFGAEASGVVPQAVEQQAETGKGGGDGGTDGDGARRKPRFWEWHLRISNPTECTAKWE